MMAIILFALIGTSIEVNWVYWICFGAVCVGEVFKINIAIKAKGEK